MQPTSNQEHIELLKDYYDYDEKNKTFIVPITYEKAEDLLDLDVKDPKNNPKFKKVAMENVKDLLMGLPSGTKANIHLIVKDYQGYDPDVLLSSFNKAIKLNQNRSRLQQRRSGVLATVLALIGAAILFVYIFGKSNGWYGEEDAGFSYDFITEILDIVAWVFLWEAVSVLFLYGDDYRSINAGLFIKINSIGFYDEKGEKMLSHEILIDTIKASSTAKKWEIIGKNLILASSVTMLMSGVFSIFNCLYALITNRMDDVQMEMILVSVLLVGILVGAVFIVLGLGGIYIYLDKPWLRKFTFVALIVIGILLAFYLVICLINNEPEHISSMAFNILIYLLFVVGYFLVWFFTKPSKKQAHN